jgi:hypothetical protein
LLIFKEGCQPKRNDPNRSPNGNLGTVVTEETKEVTEEEKEEA